MQSSGFPGMRARRAHHTPAGRGAIACRDGSRSRLRLPGCRFRPKRQHAQQRHFQPKARVRGQRKLAAPLYRNLVEQLHLVGGQRLGQRRKHPGLVVLAKNALSHRLQQGQALQGRRHFRKDIGRIGQALAQLPGAVQQGLPVANGKRVEEMHDAGLVGASEHVGHVGFAHRVRPVGDGLIQQAQGVAHAAVGGPGQPGQRPGLRFDSFALANGGELIADGLAVHGPQIDLQAARQHGHRKTMRLGGREQELHVRGRLLQRLQQRVEG